MNPPCGPLSFVPMRQHPGRLTSLLLTALLLFHGVALGLLHAQAAADARPAVSASSGQPGVPLPEHDETTCAVCHASVTLTALALARSVLPDAPAMVQRAPALAEERLPRAPATRPTGSRAPPALRSA